MNAKLILEGLIELGVSLLTGFLVFFSSLKIFMLLTRSLEEETELKKNNTAVALVLGAFVLALVLIVSSAVAPAMDTLKVVLNEESIEIGALLLALLRIVLMYVISGIVALIVLWLAIALYTGLTTKVDEMAELKKNNQAVGLIFATFIFSAGFLCSEPLTTILNSLVAPPQLSYAVVQIAFINTATLLQGLLELPLALLGTIVVFILGIKLSDLLTLRIKEAEEIKQNNLAAAIYTAAIILSVVLLVQASLAPSYLVLGKILAAEQRDVGEILLALGRIVLFFIGSALVALLLLRLALWLFMLLTRKIDEMGELKKNNVAVAILLAVVTVAIAILVKHGMQVVLEGFAVQAQPMSSIPILKVK